MSGSSGIRDAVTAAENDANENDSQIKNEPMRRGAPMYRLMETKEFRRKALVFIDMLQCGLYTRPRTQSHVPLAEPVM